MSIASEITRIQGNISDSYTAVSNKGGTLPATQNSDNLATAIATIPSGTTPTGTIQITTNGTHDVTNYASADVQVPTTAPARYIEKTVDENGVLKATPNMINLNNVTDLSSYVLYGQYYSAVFPNNTSIDMSSLTTITGNGACGYMFYNCSRGLTSVNLSSLTTVSGNSAFSYMFFNCTSLTSVDLSSLTTVSGNSVCSYMFSTCGLTSINLSSLTTVSGNSVCSYMFFNCYLLTSVDLSSLTTVSGSNAFQNMFSGCSGLISVNLNSLNNVSVLSSSQYGPVFNGCVKLESVTFGGFTAATFASATNQIQYLFGSLTGRDAPNGCTVHFPSNFDPSDPDHTFDASTLTGYPTFGGNASYIHVAFDLPATE